uniref:Uncharacterized protein n=1 Tax=Rhizophora mucronata TaxID=61149 RepID=A0A2P2L9U9_RHIMU
MKICHMCRSQKNPLQQVRIC